MNQNAFVESEKKVHDYDANKWRWTIEEIMLGEPSKNSLVHMGDTNLSTRSIV